MSDDECFSAKTLPVSGAVLSNQGVGLLSLAKTGVTMTGPAPENVKSIITDLFIEPKSTTALPEPSTAETDEAAKVVEAQTKRPRTTAAATLGIMRMRTFSIKQRIQTSVDNFLQLGFINIRAGIPRRVLQDFRTSFVHVLRWLCICSRPIAIQLPGKFTLT